MFSIKTAIICAEDSLKIQNALAVFKNDFYTVESEILDVKSFETDVLTTYPDLVIMDEALFTPDINLLFGATDVILVTPEAGKTDLGDIRYVYFPVQLIYLFKKISGIYKAHTKESIEEKQKVRLSHVETITPFITNKALINQKSEALFDGDKKKPSLIAQRKRLLAELINSTVEEPVPVSVKETDDVNAIGCIEEDVVETVIKAQDEITKNNAILSIIKSMPNKNSYPLHFKELDLSGCELTVFYSDNSTEDVLITDNDVDVVFKNSVLGAVPVLIIYKGLQTGFVINVTEPVLLNVSVFQGPNTIKYIEGDIFNPEGLIVKGIYDNGEEELFTDFADLDITLSMKDKAVTIPIIAQQYVTIPVTVTKRHDEKVEVETLPNNITYYENHFDIDLTGCVLVRTLPTGEIVSIPATKSMIKAVDSDKKLIVLSVDGLNCSFSIDIVPDEIECLMVVHPPIKEKYIENESINTEGLVACIKTKAGDYEQVHDYLLDNDTAVLGKDKFSISYKGFEAFVPIMVNPLPEIEIDSPTTETEPVHVTEEIEPIPKIKESPITKDEHEESITEKQTEELPMVPVTKFYPSTLGLRFFTVS